MLRPLINCYSITYTVINLKIYTWYKISPQWLIDTHIWTIKRQWREDNPNGSVGTLSFMILMWCLFLNFWFFTNQDEHFHGLTNLRHLILANNQLLSISSHAFDDFLSTLEDLDLSYNNLAQVPWDTIRRLTNVNTLNMDHNLIENVPQGVFTNLHKLARYIDIDYLMLREQIM